MCYLCLMWHSRSRHPTIDSPMDDQDRQRIKSNLARLCPLINLNDLVPFLFHKRIFTRTMIDDILSLDEDNKRKMRLLIDLCRRGPDAYDKFIEVLIETGHVEAARVLRPQMTFTRTGSLPYNNDLNIEVRCPSKSFSGADHVPEESLEKRQSKRIKVTPALSWATYDNVYRMESNPRGFCLLFNNVDFEADFLETRWGSDTDAHRLDQVFSELGFKVILKRNVKSYDMKTLVKRVSERKDQLAVMDALVMIVLSHGNKHIVYGTDAGIVDIQYDLVAPFNNSNCPALINKPKMFFIQACRGDNKDLGVPMKEVSFSDEISFFESEPQEDSTSKQPAKRPDSLMLKPAIADAQMTKQVFKNNCANNSSFVTFGKRISSWSDIIISYATVFGYVAMRNPDVGSWYVSALVTALASRACKMRLIDILNLVDEEVQKMQTISGDKQTSSKELIGWTKKLYFNPGLYK